MALMDEINSILEAAGGGLEIGTGINLLTQGIPDVTTVVRAAPPLRQGPLEIGLGEQFAGLTTAALRGGDEPGYELSRNAEGNLVLTPRQLTPEELANRGQLQRTNQQIEQALAGRRVESPFEARLNAQNLASTSGQPSLNRQALIAALRGPESFRFDTQPKGLALGRRELGPITVPNVAEPLYGPSTITAESTTRGRRGSGSSLGLPLGLAGGAAGLAALTKLFPNALPSLASGIAGLFGRELSPIPGVESLFGYTPSAAELESIGNAGSGMGTYDFSSLQNVPSFGDWAWIDDSILPGETFDIL